MYGPSRTSSFGLTTKLLTYQPTMATRRPLTTAGTTAAASQPSRGRPTALASAPTAPITSAIATIRQAGERHVRFGIGHAREDRVILEEPLEPAQIDPRGHHQQRNRDCHREPAPRGDARGRVTRAGNRARHRSPGARRHPRPAGDGGEESGHGPDDDRERQNPAGEQLPHGQREQIEHQRSVEDRIAGSRGGGCMPVGRQPRPLGHHAGPGCDREEEGADAGDEPQHGFDGQLNRLTVDHDRQGRQFAESRRLQDEKRSVEDGEGDEEETGEDSCLEVERPPEDVRVAKRIEPQRLDVIRDGRSARNEDEEKPAEDYEAPATASSRHVEGFSHLLHRCHFPNSVVLPRVFFVERAGNPHGVAGHGLGCLTAELPGCASDTPPLRADLPRSSWKTLPTACSSSARHGRPGRRRCGERV